MRAALRRLSDFWSEHPQTDWVLALVLIGCHALSQVTLSHETLDLARLSAERRKDLYTTTASVAALVGGFGTAAIAQYASASGRGILQLRRWFGDKLRRNWSSILTSMLAVSGGCLLALIVDSSTRIGLSIWLFETLLGLGVFRALRLVWLFNLLIRFADRDALDTPRSPGVRVPEPPPRQGL
jgi:hypothetical protein